MTKTHLAEYLNQSGQSQKKLADAVNLSQGAISKMVRTGRNIFVVVSLAGNIELLEEKPLCRNPAAPVA